MLMRKSVMALVAVLGMAGMSHAADEVLRVATVRTKNSAPLPKVLLIGDSISIGYTGLVKKLLAGKAEVSRPLDNCRYTEYGLQHSAQWVGKERWDIVHFNFGIWDVHLLDKGQIVMPPLGDRDPAGFKRRCTTKEYITNLKKIVQFIRPKTKRMIFATTTPFTSYGEGTKALIPVNNKAASELMKAEGVRVNDLYTLALPRLDTLHAEDGVHFNALGYQHIAVAVARSIADALDLQLDQEVVASVLTGTSDGKEKQEETSLQPLLLSEGTAFGRTLHIYEHANLASWGYDTMQRNTFGLVLPRKTPLAAPLCVVLHSGGGNVSEPFQPICAPHAERGFYGDATFYVLTLDCAKNRNDWWWGTEEISRKSTRYQNELCPTEKRILSTIEWVVTHFGIDRNRIYLNGISMGGSGTLGLGLNHGDVFAAVAVIVPAGISHVQTRFFARKVSDPPPLLDISSPCDPYSAGQEALMTYMREHRYAAAFAWIPWGHDAHKIGQENPLSFYAYPWLNLRRNEAYPVFSNATSDNLYPGFKNQTAPDQSGQINLYFRWKNRVDERDRFSMELWLSHPDESGKGATVLTSSTADVTFRRLQQFAVVQDREYRWRLMEGDTVRQQGKVTANKGLLTLPAVRLMQAPALLTVDFDPQSETASLSFHWKQGRSENE